MLWHINIIAICEGNPSHSALHWRHMSVMASQITGNWTVWLIICYLNLWWLIINWVLGNKLKENFNEMVTILCRQSAFENIVCKMATIFTRPQCVKYSQILSTTPVITIMWDNSHHMVYSWALIFSWTRLITSTFRRRQDGRRFPDDIFKCIFLNENDKITIQISLKFVPTVTVYIKHKAMQRRVDIL